MTRTAKFLSLLTLLMIFTGKIYAQHKITHLSATELVEKLYKGDKRASVVQYWIPNCATAESQVQQFKIWQETYGNQIDFYFIGITNKDSLVLNLIDKTNYTYPLYIIDATVDANLNQRMQTFSMQLNQLLKRKPQSFITLYWNNKKQAIQLDRKATINGKKLTKLLQG